MSRSTSKTLTSIATKLSRKTWEKSTPAYKINITRRPKFSRNNLTEGVLRNPNVSFNFIYMQLPTQMLHRYIANEIRRPYRDNSHLNRDLVSQRCIKLRKILGISLFSHDTNINNRKIRLLMIISFKDVQHL